MHKVFLACCAVNCCLVMVSMTQLPQLPCSNPYWPATVSQLTGRYYATTYNHEVAPPPTPPPEATVLQQPQIWIGLSACRLLLGCLAEPSFTFHGLRSLEPPSPTQLSHIIHVLSFLLSSLWYPLSRDLRSLPFPSLSPLSDGRVERCWDLVSFLVGRCEERTCSLLSKFGFGHAA
jgi:hypothetical protein